MIAGFVKCVGAPEYAIVSRVCVFVEALTDYFVELLLLSGMCHAK